MRLEKSKVMEGDKRGRGRASEGKTNKEGEEERQR